MDFLVSLWNALPDGLQVLIWTLVKIVAIVAPLMLVVAYYTYAERKIIGYMQVRIGPNRVGPKGWLQPIADAVKLMFKEIVVPSGAKTEQVVVEVALVGGGRGYFDAARVKRSQAEVED